MLYSGNLPALPGRDGHQHIVWLIYHHVHNRGQYSDIQHIQDHDYPVSQYKRIFNYHQVIPGSGISLYHAGPGCLYWIHSPDDTHAPAEQGSDRKHFPQNRE